MSTSKNPVLILIASVVLMAAVPSAVAAEPDTAESYGDDYATGDYGRVRYQENDVVILRAASDDRPSSADEVSVNSPVFPGDRVATGADQRAEIQLAGGSLVRVDRGTELTFQALPDPYAEISDNSILKLAYGTVQVSSQLGDREEFRIDTPDASVYLLGDGDFRIEVDAQGETRVRSRRGVAEVVGDGGSVLIRGGMYTTVVAGSVPEDPTPFNTFSADVFDRWAGERDDVYAVAAAGSAAADDAAVVYQEIPVEVRPYYVELRRYGRWVYVRDYGYAWYPYDVPAGWRPYYDGYWSYGPRGYFWVSYEPWGWAPYHYGRWSWVAGYGWCWVPGRVFAGAWVSWSFGSAYVGWAPLDYWNRPAYVRGIHYGYYDPHCWTFVRYDHFHGYYGRRGWSGHGRHRVSVEDVGDDLRHSAVVTRPPRVGPRDLSEDPVARDRAVREARANPRAGRPATPAEARPERTFADVEDRAVRRGRGVPAVAARGTVPGDGGPAAGRRPSVSRREVPASVPGGRAVSRPSAGEPSTSSRARGRPAGPVTEGNDVPDRRATPSPRVRPSTPPSAVPERARVPAGRERGSERSGTEAGERRGTTREVPAARERSATPQRSRSGDSRQTDANLRTLYRRVAEPRKTEPQKAPPQKQRAPSARRSPSPSRETRSAAPRTSNRPAPEAKPQRPSSSRGAPPKAAPRGRSDRESGSKASGSSSKGGSARGSRGRGSKSDGKKK